MEEFLLYSLLVYLVLSCFVVFLRTKSFLHPVFLFNFIWFLLLCLYSWRWSALQQELSVNTLLILSFAILFFDIGAFLVSGFFRNSLSSCSLPNECLCAPVLLECEKEFNTQKSKRLLIADCLVLLIFIVEIVYSGGFPLLWKLTGSPKTYFDFGIPSLTGAWYGAVILLGAYHFNRKGITKWLYLSIGILVISRQILISMVLESLVLFFLFRNEKLGSRLLFGLAGLVAIGFVAFSLIGNFRSGDAMERYFTPREGYEWLPSSFRWVYSYICFSLNNFNNLVSLTPGGVNGGASSLSFFLPTVISRAVSIHETWSQPYLVHPQFTVSTYLPPIYLDFGPGGVAVFNALIGCLGSYFYYSLKLNGTMRSKMLYSVFCHNIALLFFVNMFLYLPVAVQFIYAVLLFPKEEFFNAKTRNLVGVVLADLV